MPTPHTRGLAARTALDHVDDFVRGRGAAVRARIPEASLAAIDDCPSAGWIPVEHEHWVTKAIFAELGADAVGYFRWLTSGRLAQTPMLRPILEQARRMFGVDPGTFLRLGPRAFSLMFRDFGQLAMVDRGPQHATLVLSHCHDAVFEHPDYAQSWVGAMAACFDLALARGDARLELDEPGARLQFLLTW
ncbi:MAG: hypothetical protein K1X88_22305 [Nannocystaceae bacterium]|nr:hypothetical protein [Nannocystaceae bacterium]